MVACKQRHTCHKSLIAHQLRINYLIRAIKPKCGRLPPDLGANRPRYFEPLATLVVYRVEAERLQELMHAAEDPLAGKLRHHVRHLW